MPVKPSDESLTRFLREADPAAGDPGLSPEARNIMRRAVLAAVPAKETARWRQLAPALSVASLLAVALGVAWWPTAVDYSTAPLTPPSDALAIDRVPSAPLIGRGGNTLEKRMIQFQTPGGTLVVWVLDPEFPS